MFVLAGGRNLKRSRGKGKEPAVQAASEIDRELDAEEEVDGREGNDEDEPSDDDDDLLTRRKGKQGNRGADGSSGVGAGKGRGAVLNPKGKPRKGGKQQAARRAPAFGPTAKGAGKRARRA